MGSMFDDVFSEAGLPSVMDTLGESVTFRSMTDGEEYEEVTASPSPERQEEVIIEDRERRLTMRDFTFATADIPTPLKDDEIDLGSATYVIDRIAHTSESAIRVTAWRKLSTTKTRRGQRGMG